MVTGEPEQAALGVQSYMNVDSDELRTQMNRGLAAIEAEFVALAQSAPQAMVQLAFLTENSWSAAWSDTPIVVIISAAFSFITLARYRSSSEAQRYTSNTDAAHEERGAASPLALAAT